MGESTGEPMEMWVLTPIVGQMRKRGKSFLVTSEKHEVVVIRRQSPDLMHAMCQGCTAEAELLTFDAAIEFSGFSGRELVRLIEAGQVHSVELPGNQFGLCRRSLEMEKENVRKHC